MASRCRLQILVLIPATCWSNSPRWSTILKIQRRLYCVLWLRVFKLHVGTTIVFTNQYTTYSAVPKEFQFSRGSATIKKNRSLTTNIRRQNYKYHRTDLDLHRRGPYYCSDCYHRVTTLLSAVTSWNEATLASSFHPAQESGKNPTVIFSRKNNE